MSKSKPKNYKLIEKTVNEILLRQSVPTNDETMQNSGSSEQTLLQKQIQAQMSGEPQDDDMSSDMSESEYESSSSMRATPNERNVPQKGQRARFSSIKEFGTSQKQIEIVNEKSKKLIKKRKNKQQKKLEETPAEDKIQKVYQNTLTGVQSKLNPIEVQETKELKQEKIKQKIQRLVQAEKEKNYLSFDKIFDLLLHLQVESHLIETYKNSISKNERSIKFAARKLAPEQVFKAQHNLAIERKGYKIENVKMFYNELKRQDFVCRTLEEFRLMVLPMFYFLHGEAYDSNAQPDSYDIKQCSQYLQICCLKCKNKVFPLTFTAEFSFKIDEDTDEPIEIEVGGRGILCHSLHYEGLHQLQGYDLYPERVAPPTTSRRQHESDYQGDVFRDLILIVQNQPLLDQKEIYEQLKREKKENRTFIKQYMKENGHNENSILDYPQIEMKTYLDKPQKEKIIEINLPSPERCCSLQVQMTMPQTVMVVPSPIYELELRNSFYEKVTVTSQEFFQEEEEKTAEPEPVVVNYGNWQKFNLTLPTIPELPEDSQSEIFTSKGGNSRKPSFAGNDIMGTGTATPDRDRSILLITSTPTPEVVVPTQNYHQSRSFCFQFLLKNRCIFMEKCKFWHPDREKFPFVNCYKCCAFYCLKKNGCAFAICSKMHHKKCREETQYILKRGPRNE